MTDAQRTLKQMILEGMYVVDERSVAEAIVARAGARTAVARTSFRSDGVRRTVDRLGLRRNLRAGSLLPDAPGAPGI